MITVIDHLGNVSANLECLIDSPDEFSQTELRMDGLQHVSILVRVLHLVFDEISGLTALENKWFLS